MSSQINVDNLDEFGVPYPGYQAWLSGVGLDGAGVTVAIVDEGVDQGHPDLAAGYLPCLGPSCTATPSIHGTHVAGIVTGDGTSGVTDTYGFLRGLGVAPGTAYFEQEFILFRFLPGGVSELIADSIRNGATVSNNSWGTSTIARGYNADALMLDAGVRDADPVEPGNQPLFYVQAIGNGGGGVSSQGAPDEAKNVVVVGSTWAVDIDGNPIPSVDSLSDNSAHGPALDGRTIPHIVAPGCRVDSTTPDLGEGYDFINQCGTSMAAPQVSGAAALFIQHYRSLPGSPGDPSPALIKAALLAGARDLEGNLDADGVAMGHRPDSKQGWGRLDLRSLVEQPAGERDLPRPDPGLRGDRRKLVARGRAGEPERTDAHHARLDRRAGPRPRRQHPGVEQRPRPRRRSGRQLLPRQRVRRRRLVDDRRNRRRHEQRRGRVLRRSSGAGHDPRGGREPQLGRRP